MPETTEHVVTVTNLLLRQSPSISSDVVGRLPRATWVQLLGQTPDGQWSQVQIGKRIGWMASQYLEPIGSPLAPLDVAEEYSWMPIALREIGVRENLAPDQSCARVVEYLRTTTLDEAQASNDATPWCSGFVNWCLEHAGVAGTRSAAARSWLDWGRPLVKPRRGVITVLSRGAGGHVGFYIGRGTLSFGGQPSVDLLGGNQNNEVCIASFDPDRVLGYRVPR